MGRMTRPVSAVVSGWQVSIALLVGIWTGAMLLNDLSPMVALLRTFDTQVVGAIADPEHTAVLLFTLILGGTIGLVQKGGGALGLANLMKNFAKDAKSCLRTSALLSLLIFFDDYSRCGSVNPSLIRA